MKSVENYIEKAWDFIVGVIYITFKIAGKLIMIPISLMGFPFVVLMYSIHARDVEEFKDDVKYFYSEIFNFKS